MSAAGGLQPEPVRTTGTCGSCGAHPVEGALIVTVDERTELVDHCRRPPQQLGERPRRHQRAR
ncbi:hypothetical protein ACFC26_16335 [Kitasatospora purpeofusca]|uniref:hypothetical protein n=1 Tax=Kitasatospora purpeofusca TaxID=67352 RepID=UPI0035E24BA0